MQVAAFCTRSGFCLSANHKGSAANLQPSLAAAIPLRFRHPAKRTPRKLKLLAERVRYIRNLPLFNNQPPRDDRTTISPVVASLQQQPLPATIDRSVGRVVQL